MKIFVMNEKMKKFILDLIYKIKKKPHASDTAANNDAIIMDDNDDGIELLSVIENLGNDEVL